MTRLVPMDRIDAEDLENAAATLELKNDDYQNYDMLCQALRGLARRYENEEEYGD